MPDINDLAGRIDAEFSAVEEKVKKDQSEAMKEYQERQKRIQQLGQVLNQLRDVWRPRLEVLVQKFGERVKVVQQRLAPSTREVTFEFQSTRARIRLKLAASTDRDVTRVILSYDLEIIPVLMRFDAHAELELPLDAVTPEAVAGWIDDRIVSFVRTYLSLQESDHFLKDQMVEDPVAHIRFPKFAAGATLERNGQTWYFVSAETRQEFEKQT